MGLAERIRLRIGQHTFCSEPGDIHPEALYLRGITCSVGVATLLRHIEADVEESEAKSSLLRHADMAMYIAKETGRDRIQVAPVGDVAEKLPLRRSHAD